MVYLMLSDSDRSLCFQSVINHHTIKIIQSIGSCQLLARHHGLSSLCPGLLWEWSCPFRSCSQVRRLMGLKTVVSDDRIGGSPDDRILLNWEDWSANKSHLYQSCQSHSCCISSMCSILANKGQTAKWPLHLITKNTCTVNSDLEEGSKSIRYFGNSNHQEISET